MTALLALLITCPQPAPAPVLVPVERGTVKHYYEGKMNEVRYNRTTPGRRGYIRGLVVLDSVDGYASRVDCGTLGSVFWASVNGGKLRSYQQLDCSAPVDAPRHRRTGLIAELDYESAVATGIAGRGRGQVTIWGFGR